MKIILSLEQEHKLSAGPFDAIFFDLHGTLTIPMRPVAEDTTPVLIDAFEALGLDTAQIDPTALNPDIWAVPTVPATADGTVYQHRLADYVNGRFGTALDAGDFRPAADAVCAKWQSGFRPDPDVLPVLTHLSETIPVGLVSNFEHPPHVYRLLSEMDLTNSFHTIVISGEVDIEKPDPAILELACRNLNVSAPRCTYVGDGYVDYRAATDAGMFFHWIRRPEIQDWNAQKTGGKFEETDAELSRLGETGEIRVISSLIELVAEDSSLGH